jgi:class 3 adenylate cyclase
MDPEDLREVITAYQKCVAEAVRRFGGFVAKYMGDGVLVYFGYPQAHEHDAEQAVRPGLELIAAVGGLKSSAPLQTRCGHCRRIGRGRRPDWVGFCAGA